VAGRAILGIDPFFYPELLAKDPDLPPLIYTWDVMRIQAQTAPVALHGRVWVSDMSSVRYEDREATDAWADREDRSLTYLLHCRLLDDPPKRVSAPAT
jgi:hypothetical protein